MKSCCGAAKAIGNNKNLKCKCTQIPFIRLVDNTWSVVASALKRHISQSLFFIILCSSRCFLLARPTRLFVSDCCCTRVWHIMGHRVLTQIHTDCHHSDNKLGPWSWCHSSWQRGRTLETNRGASRALTHHPHVCTAASTTVVTNSTCWQRSNLA